MLFAGAWTSAGIGCVLCARTTAHGSPLEEYLLAFNHLARSCLTLANLSSKTYLSCLKHPKPTAAIFQVYCLGYREVET